MKNKCQTCLLSDNHKQITIYLLYYDIHPSLNLSWPLRASFTMPKFWCVCSIIILLWANYNMMSPKISDWLFLWVFCPCSITDSLWIDIKYCCEGFNVKCEPKRLSAYPYLTNWSKRWTSGKGNRYHEEK